MSFYRFLGAGLCVWLAIACSDNQEKPEGKKEAAEDATVGTDGGSGDGGSDGSTDGGTSDTDGTDFVEEDPGNPDEPQSIEELLKQCGGEDVADADPNEVIYEKTVKSIPITKNYLVVRVNAQSTLAIKVTGSEAIQDTTVDIETTGILSGFAEGFVDGLRGENTGATTFTNVPFSEYSSLGSDHKAWEGVLCTFVPARKVINNKGERDTVVEFDPPLPSSVSPRADAARYKAEIGDSRTFKDIKAVIKRSDHPELDGVSEIIGTVKVEKVDATATIAPDGGDSIDVNADIAFKVTYDFGSPEQTFALGLPPEVTYYISHEKKDLLANLVDTKGTTGKVVFVHDESLMPEEE